MAGIPGTPAPPSTSVPWWAHVLIGAIAIAFSVAMIFAAHDPTSVTLGQEGFGAGLSFLGVGIGVGVTQ